MYKKLKIIIQFFNYNNDNYVKFKFDKVIANKSWIPDKKFKIYLSKVNFNTTIHLKTEKSKKLII